MVKYGIIYGVAAPYVHAYLSALKRVFALHNLFRESFRIFINVMHLEMPPSANLIVRKVY